MAPQLNENEIKHICKDAFEKIPFHEKRLLFIIPDHTRTAPLPMMFQILYEMLSESVRKMDFIVALGTHPPLADDRLYGLLGVTKSEFEQKYKQSQIFNHFWDNPEQLCTIGSISREEVREISNGLMVEEVPVSINRLIFEYDILIILGPTFPHEVVGFSGGNKYLFPGIAGKEIINMFHWLGALITSPAIIGKKDTPVRQIVNRAAALVKMEKYCMSMVISGEALAGLYIGSPEDAWGRAAEHSRNLHIVYKDRPFKSVLACAPTMYDDLWTGGKCMYKLEPVVADGGELIIYAPHITEVSQTHGHEIESIGYHVRDFFTKQSDRYKHISGGVLAHSTHVKGIGTYENEIEKPRVSVVLATRMSEERCRKINLGYRDLNLINVKEWQNRESEGRLFVSNAGEMLYRLKQDPF
jgi:nickel-dependent lactate racemase